MSKIEIPKTTHRIVIYYDDGEWVAEFPDLPGCVGVGTTELEAFQHAMIHKNLWLETCILNNEPIPKASKYNGIIPSVTVAPEAIELLIKRDQEVLKQCKNCHYAEDSPDKPPCIDCWCLSGWWPSADIVAAYKKVKAGIYD